MMSSEMEHKEHMYHCEVKPEKLETADIATTESEFPTIYLEKEDDHEGLDSQLDYEVVITPAYLIRTHTGKRPFLCQTCNTAVWPKERPSNHVQIMSGCRPIVRHVYYMNFTRKNLTLCTNWKGKPKWKGCKRAYACDRCGKVLRHKSHFDAHLRMHSGEKPFSCTYCEKSFGQKSNLTSHMKRHLQDAKMGAMSMKKRPQEGGSSIEKIAVSTNKVPQEGGSKTKTKNKVNIKAAEEGGSSCTVFKSVPLDVNPSVPDSPPETKAPDGQEPESAPDLPIVYVDMADEYIEEVVIKDELLESDLSQASKPEVVFKASLSREKSFVGQPCKTVDDETKSPPLKKRNTRDLGKDSSELGSDGDYLSEKKNSNTGSVLHSYAVKNVDLVPSSSSSLTSSTSSSFSSSSSSKLSSVKSEIVKE